MSKNSATDAEIVFVAKAHEPPLRDFRDAMIYPFVSIAKRQSTPISFADSAVRFQVVGTQEWGLPTIWDWDLIIWLLSQINESKELGLHVAPRINFRPSRFFKDVGRSASGKSYQELANTVRRLRTSTILTCRQSLGGLATEKPFSWLASYQLPLKDKCEPDTGRLWTVEFPDWLFSAVCEQKTLLAIHPHYFSLQSGIERALYRVARKSVPKDQGYWAWRMDTLHARLCVRRPLRSFSRDVREISKRNLIPEYQIEVRRKRAHELVVFTLDPSKPPRPRRGAFHPDQKLFEEDSA